MGRPGAQSGSLCCPISVSPPLESGPFYKRGYRFGPFLSSFTKTALPTGKHFNFGLGLSIAPPCIRIDSLLGFLPHEVVRLILSLFLPSFFFFGFFFSQPRLNALKSPPGPDRLVPSSKQMFFPPQRFSLLGFGVGEWWKAVFEGMVAFFQIPSIVTFFHFSLLVFFPLRGKAAPFFLPRFRPRPFLLTFFATKVAKSVMVGSWAFSSEGLSARFGRPQSSATYPPCAPPFEVFATPFVSRPVSVFWRIVDATSLHVRGFTKSGVPFGMARTPCSSAWSMAIGLCSIMPCCPFVDPVETRHLPVSSPRW